MATTYARAAEAIEAVIDDQVVILAPVDFSYHSLDPVGARVWELLSEPRSLDDLVGALTEEFDVAPDVCRADVQPFLDRMLDLGALTAVE